MRRSKTRQAIAGALLVVDQTVAAFVADSNVFRQVVAIAQRAGPRRPGGAMPSDAQVPLMRRAQAIGILRDDVDAAGIARQIFVSYTGAMALWSVGRLDDAGFSAANSRGLVKLGSGTLELTQINTYTGRTLLHGGTLAIAKGSANVLSSTTYNIAAGGDLTAATPESATLTTAGSTLKVAAGDQFKATYVLTTAASGNAATVIVAIEPDIW